MLMMQLIFTVNIVLIVRHYQSHVEKIQTQVVS